MAISDMNGQVALNPVESAPLEAKACPSIQPRLGPIEVAGQQVWLFEESAPLMEAMVADIASAQNRVWMESYTIMDDAAGKAVAAALAQRARAGVECRLMYDAVGSVTTSASFFRGLAEAGVKVHAYHTIWHALRRFSLFQVFNRRNHRKLLVVDDRVAFFGGMNVVDQSGIKSPADVRKRDLPISSGWRDIHVRLVGSKQAEVADALDRLWRRKHDMPRKRAGRWPVREMLCTPGEHVCFFDSRPKLRHRRVTSVLVPLFRRARRHITLTMAYFIPQGRVLRELLRARRRGVTVRVIIPGQSDVKVVQWATRHFYERLLKRGVRIYERKDQMLHSKALVIDDEWSVIGSCNLDPRSMRLNLEFCAVFRSRAMAAAVGRICCYELRNSRRVTMNDLHRRTFWRRTLDRMAWSFRKWL